MFKTTNELVKKIIKHCDVYGFFKPVFTNDRLSHYTFGSSGKLLKDAIKNEWIYSNIINRESNVFMFDSGKENNFESEIKEAFSWARNFSNSELPFGLADSEKMCTLDDDKVPELLEPKQYSALKYIAFIGPQEAEQFFYRYQQQRKRWWRKFSLDPGKFSFAEVEKKDDDMDHLAKIIAEFSWGNHTLETIRYDGTKPFECSNLKDTNFFNVKSVRKRCLPHAVVCEVNLDYAAISYICDAFTSKKGRVILNFHRKLAPFKFAFAANPGNDEEECKSLFEVAELMCLQLRKAGLSSILPVKGDFAKKKLELQLLKSDSLGIPYTAVITNETLTTGIFGLYSRDTTLQEQVHISKFPDYGVLLMKNY